MKQWLSDNKPVLELFYQGLLPAMLLFFGWIWLLHFPWFWVLKTLVVIDLLLLLLVLWIETSARNVNGAGGWFAFALILGQLYAAVILSIIRLILFLLEKLGDWTF